jgi:hypothetical protein
MEYPMVDRCALDPEMSTKGRGSINPAERGNMIFPGEIEHQPVNSFGFGSDCTEDAGGDPDNRTGA